MPWSSWCFFGTHSALFFNISLGTFSDRLLIALLALLFLTLADCGWSNMSFKLEETCTKQKDIEKHKAKLEVLN